jgi:hypothetical protein
LEPHFHTLCGILKICEKDSNTHYVRFLNLKLLYLVQLNGPDMLHRCISLAHLTFDLYNYDEHSNDMITLYGSDRGLETIALGNIITHLSVYCPYSLLSLPKVQYTILWLGIL